MFKKLSLVCAVVVASIFAASSVSADVCRVNSSYRNNVQRFNVQKFNVVDRNFHHRNNVLLIQNNVNHAYRNVRIVEVPNFNVQTQLVIVRDNHGNIVNVVRQNVVDKNKFNHNNQNFIIRQNVIRGY